MEWIVEAESLSDFVDHGRYTIHTKPLIRCRDCKYRGGLSGFYCDNMEKAVGVDSFCSWAERRIDEGD